MSDSLFLDKSDINNFDDIMYVIFNYGLQKDVLAVENTGDIISYLDKYDKVRDLNDPDLKKAVLTIIKVMLETGEVELEFRYSWVQHVQQNPPKTEKEIFTFLNKYWDEDDGYGMAKILLVWFRRKGQSF
jgi:hypothetical protein